MKELLLIYDGKCGFCRCWVGRLERWLDFPGKFVPYQEDLHRPLLEMDWEQFQEGVVLYEPGRGVGQGGEAVLRLLALSGHLRGLLKMYERSRLVRKIIDSSYQFVSHHRKVWSRLTFCH